MFQRAVIGKYIEKHKGLNGEHLRAMYDRYSAHFLNYSKQDELRSIREEEYQGGFLRDLFVQCLGYSLKPSEGYNFATEVDFNILGHIFENSLTEIEEITTTPQTTQSTKWSTNFTN